MCCAAAVCCALKHKPQSAASSLLLRLFRICYEVVRREHSLCHLVMAFAWTQVQSTCAGVLRLRSTAVLCYLWVVCRMEDCVRVVESLRVCCWCWLVGLDCCWYSSD